MKKNMLKWNVIALVGLIIGFSSCGEEISPETKEVSSITETETETETEKVIAYSVPTPNELFAVIKETGVLYDGSILNSPDNSEKYSSKKMQALNFGVYFADLAFASSFEENASILGYFTTIKVLSDELGISNALDAAIYEKVDMSLENDDSDSLLFLSNDAYFQAYSYLENGNNAAFIKENTLPSAGFIGYKAIERQKKSLIFGEESLGRGNIIYLVDNVLFRSFWYSGKIVFANALFF